MPGNLPYWRLSGFYFFYFAFVGAFTPYWSLYLRSIEFDAFQIGLLMSLLQVTRIFAPPAWGWVADHTGRRAAVVRLAAGLSLASFAGVFLGTSFAWMFVVLTLTGFFWGASLPLVEAMTLAHLGSGAGRYGRIRSWGSVGFIAAVLGVGYVLDRVPVAALPGMVTVAMLGIVLFAGLIPDARVPPHESDQLSGWAILRRPEVLALLAACFLMAAAHGPYYIFYSLYLVDHGYSKASVGALWAVGVACEIGVFFAMPWLTQRLGLKRILVASFAAAVLRFLLIGWAVEAVALMVAAQALHALTFGAYHAAAVTVIYRFFPGRHQSKGQTLYTGLSFGAGGTVGGLFSGAAWEPLGASVTFSAAALAALLGLGLIAGRLQRC
ncbi:MAG TPA: MFS transporter [Burkholderiales bacterium]